MSDHNRSDHLFIVVVATRGLTELPDLLVQALVDAREKASVPDPSRGAL